MRGGWHKARGEEWGMGSSGMFSGYALFEWSLLKAWTSAMSGGKPVKSRLNRRIKVWGAASGDNDNLC